VLALRDHGHHIALHTLSPDAADFGEFHAPALTVSVGPFRRHGRARDGFRKEREALSSSLRRHPVDLLHAHWTYEFALAALQDGRPSIITVRDWAPAIFRHHPHPYRAVRWAMQHRVLRRAPHLVSTSPYIANRLLKHYGRETPIIPNGFYFADGGSPRRPRLATELRIGSVNNGFSRRKNVHALIRAFGLVRAQMPDATLHLVGSGFERGGPAYAFAAQHGLTSGIEFVGPQSPSRIPDVMRSLDILVHPALEESFGRTLLEAINEGAIVIAGRNSGAVPWVLGEGVAGELVDVRDPGAIAVAVLRLASQPERWQVRRSAAFGHASANFSLDFVARSYENLYCMASDTQP
jgi:L-malate glycosyltransferase